MIVTDYKLDREVFLSDAFLKRKVNERAGKEDIEQYLDTKQKEMNTILKESQSKLLNRIDDVALLAKGFKEKPFKLTLVMQGSRDGFTASKFHKLCDGIPNTLSLFESNSGHLFGGFTSIPWSSPKSNKAIADPHAWLFSMTHDSIHP